MKAIKKHRALGALACSARLRKLHFGMKPKLLAKF